MKFLVLTIFPELLEAFWGNGIMRRAVDSGSIETYAVNIRDFAVGRHHVTDDRPYGGGCGMVMKPEPLAAAIDAAKTEAPKAQVIMLTPQGRSFDQAGAQELAAQNELILICGRYEGIDERIANRYVDAEISIGDYVLTGGELPAMVVMDAVTRLLPGALGNEASADQDSFCRQRLDHAHFTRPPEFDGQGVPQILLTGHHERIAQWRLADALMRTLVKRPDLLHDAELSEDEVRLLESWRLDIERITRRKGTRGPGSPGIDSPPGGG